MGPHANKYIAAAAGKYGAIVEACPYVQVSVARDGQLGKEPWEWKDAERLGFLGSGKSSPAAKHTFFCLKFLNKGIKP